MSFVKSHKGLLGLLIAVVALMAAACGGSDPAPAPAATAETRIVEVTTEVVREVVVTQEVELIREVQVTQEVQVEVEKIVEVVREVEVIKEVEVMAPSGPKETIIFSDLNWTSVQLQNRIAMFIVENGYGYPVDTVTGNTISGFVALENGDTHVSMEIWLPNQQVVWDKAIKDGAVLSVGKSLDDNWQSTFVVPTYVIEANPGLVKVSDLPDYMHLFATPDSDGKARLIGCIPGWECEITGANKVITYGLEDVVDLTSPGSAASLFADLYGAYQKGELGLATCGAPHRPQPSWTLRFSKSPRTATNVGPATRDVRSRRRRSSSLCTQAWRLGPLTWSSSCELGTLQPAPRWRLRHGCPRTTKRLRPRRSGTYRPRNPSGLSTFPQTLPQRSRRHSRPNRDSPGPAIRPRTDGSKQRGRQAAPPLLSPASHAPRHRPGECFPFQSASCGVYRVSCC